MQGGSVFTKDNVMNYLEKYNKDYVNHQAWRDMFSSVNFNQDSAINAVKNDYSGAMGQAYATSHKAGTDIMGSNLISGNKTAAMIANEDALNQAYDAYISKMAGDVSGIVNQSSKNLSQLAGQYAGQIEEQQKVWNRDAENIVKYGDAHVGYLQSLWDRYQNGEIDGTFFNDRKWDNYFNNVYNEEGVQLYADDERTQPIRELKDANELRKMMFDDKGNITNFGKDFFDRLEHADELRDYSFGDYLHDTDNELYDWAMSYNPYSDAVNAQGDQIYDAAFREMVGQVSTDEGYSFFEHQYGMDNGQIQGYFDSTMKAQNKLMRAIKAEDKTKIDSASKELGGELESVLDEFGIKESFLESLSKSKLADYNITSISDFVNQVADMYLEKVSTGEAVTTSLNHMLQESSSMMAIGGTVGVKIGGPAGMAFLGLLGGALGLLKGSIENITDYYPEVQEQNEKAHYNNTVENSEKMKSLYNDFVASAILYAQTLDTENKESFKQEESMNGGTITNYDPYVSQHKGYYNYRLKDGSTVTFLSSGKFDGIELKKHSGVRDKENDDFSVTYNNEKYRLQVGDEKLDGKVLGQAKDFVQMSSGRDAQEGDIFMYDNRLWVVTKDGTARSVKNPFWGTDYAELLRQIRGK